jgi:plastocyanin
MDRRSFLAGVGAAGAGALAGCASLASGEEYDVGMTATAFDPTEVTVSVGESVTWYNNSSRRHTVTAYDDGIPEGAAYFATGGYESEAAAREAWRDGDGAINSGKRYSHRFEVAGTYDYVCIPHERGGMVGRVVVEQ